MSHLDKPGEVEIGYYVEINRGSWAKENGKLAQTFPASGLSYSGSLTKEQMEGIDGLIRSYLEGKTTSPEIALPEIHYCPVAPTVEQKDAAHESGLAALGDCRLVWVAEGDFWSWRAAFKTVEHLALSKPASDPSATPHNVEAPQAQGSNLGSREGPARPAAASAPSHAPRMTPKQLDALRMLNNAFESHDGRPVEQAIITRADYRLLYEALAEGTAGDRIAQELLSTPSATRESIIEECATAVEDAGGDNETYHAEAVRALKNTPDDEAKA